ncbi:hypothetical protein G3O08_20215 [Cryomorpha ignava]|uniref:DNA alkylation repair protein n=1 Tax=Cryomorpha ignava TaxID=101383 RepID=A0A7K3WW89_9FLAO|nr:hypothetical protein [Cryomorpha ignava]NEN25818.1 hypothetical protein [Cryomorpha ignava]
MTVDEVVSKLKSESKEGVKNGWSILDTCGEETFGLNFSRVQNVAKNIKNDPCLADELYASTNHDLKVLATYIDDGKSYSLDELNNRVKQLYLSPFAEKFCHHVMAKSPHAVHFIDEWTNCEIGDYKCYAYFTLAEVARQKNNLSDEFYARQLREIAARFHEEPDTVKQAMQEAILSIGCRDSKLKKQSYIVAGAIGKVSLEDGKVNDTTQKLEKKLNVRKLMKT